VLFIHHSSLIIHHCLPWPSPLARALIEAAPARVIWGSDHPHLSFADKVDSVELFNLLGRWAPDEATRREILVDNPRQLFKF
jgi:predicted TIM-barrel fold metal-dependent hydrolase